MRLSDLRILSFLALGFLGLLGSCSPSVPQIIQTFTQLNYHSDPKEQQIRETLSLYLQVSNEDGIQDLSEIHLLQDNSELFWTLNPSSWTQIDRPGETWVGSNHIWMPFESTFPRGTYRLELLNKAGDRAKGEIFIDAVPLQEYKKTIPSITRSGEKFLIQNGPSSYLIWVFSSDRRLLATYRGTSSEFIRAALIDDPRQRVTATEIYLYYFDQEVSVGIIVGPYNF